MKKIAHIIAFSMLLSGCSRSVVESSSFKNYTIVEIKRPKHFRVSLKDETGRVFSNVNVSKHCNRWREVKIGDVVNLNTIIWKNEENTDRWVVIEARRVCPGNQ